MTISGFRHRRARSVDGGVWSLRASLPVAVFGVTLSVSSVGAPADSFAERVGPILKQNCTPCHDDSSRSGGLSVLNKADLIAGGGSGVPVQAGRPDESLLIKRLRGQTTPRMPLGGKPLSEDDIAVVADWIKNLAPAEVPSASGPSSWWAFQRPKAGALP